MILRALSTKPTASSNASAPANAWDVFLKSQQHATAPYAIILQADHSRLAGDLAAALLPSLFGDLNGDVIRAIAEHDFGWQEKDARELERLPGTDPRPFPALNAAETLPSWQHSIDHARSITPLIEALVSRHFSLLGAADPDRAGFVQAENERRARIEQSLPFTPVDLDRWADALGFCDLLSLYLASGCESTVELPLAHPSGPRASTAPRTTLTWEHGSPRFSSPVLHLGTDVQIHAQTCSGSSTQLVPQTFCWNFIAG